MLELTKIVAFVSVFCLIFFGSIAWSVFQWRECKDMGHSTFYCVGHIVK